MKTKTTKEFDAAFDAGNDITDSLDLSRSKRVNCEQKRVNVDFPIWMLNELDREARRLGMPRQSLIKTLIGRHYEEKRV